MVGDWLCGNGGRDHHLSPFSYRASKILTIMASNTLPPPAPNHTRHTLPPESELRIEVPFGITCTVTLRGGGGTSSGGSAEIFGAEIPPERPIRLTATKVAIFTWHGCTLDVSDEDKLDIAYVSEETDANVSYVNTHAQLEAMRDEALASLLPATNPQQGMLSDHNKDGDNDNADVEGPRVLLVGPADCGKSSLARVLSSYAVKLGRTPLLVDLDASQNMLSVPGTMAVCPISADGISAESNGTASLMMSGGGGSNNAVMPFVLFYGSQDLNDHPDLYKAQLDKMGKVIDGRLSGDVDARASGIIVNASGLIEDVGYTYLLHAIDSFRINVVIVLGHDRLYSMLGTHFKKQAQQQQQQNEDTTTVEVVKVTKQPKLIKLPRSGGVVSRDASWLRALRSQCIKRYFYGDTIPPKPTDPTTASTSAAASTQYRFTPSLVEVPFADVQLHQLSNISLSASMLPVSAKQSTDPIQLTTLSSSDITPKLQHAVLAVCHPSAVEKYEQSGRARDLYLSGVAGFVAVEKVDVSKEVLSLLSPCAGSLPSQHLLVGDNITWVE
eukprot:scaffold14392_cov151-Skeletonema_menzelii.AAC.17